MSAREKRPYTAVSSSFTADVQEPSAEITANGLAHVDLLGDSSLRVATRDSEWCRRASAVLLAAAQGLEAARDAREAVAAQLAPDGAAGAEAAR